MENKCLSLYDFVTLMLIHLAKNSQIIDVTNPNLKYACIPFSYKEIIQNIFCAENRWKEMFSTIINVDEYFDDHFVWEINMSNALDKVIKNMNKIVKVDFVRDKFIITFTDDEINNLIKQYPNEEINNSMDHFTNLLTSCQPTFITFCVNQRRRFFQLFDAIYYAKQTQIKRIYLLEIDP